MRHHAFKVYILAGASIVMLMTGCTSAPDRTATRAKKPLHVVASFYPLGEFARAVGGSYADVSTLVPTGAEPHDFEPSPQDIVNIENANIFVYNGAGFEQWVERLLPDIRNKQIAIVNSSSNVKLITTSSGIDPHVWLDPKRAQTIVTAIAHAYITIDPTRAATYRSNADQYNKQLAVLDDAYRAALATCARRDIITSHNAFAYLADRYNLNVIALSGLSPEQEPSSQQLAQLANQARAENIKYIFFETLVSPRLSQTLANEIGAQTLVFNPIEGLTADDIQHNRNYLSIQYDNLHNLETALACTPTKKPS